MLTKLRPDVHCVKLCS